ncbi:MAG: FadR family transcriptional regulator [Chitinophagia bacterium]|nr:FadR family transcriptional regulator [Chitinophagia bacterium]
MRGVLKAIDTSTLVDRVEAKLVELLQSRQLKLGDSIPKEVELAEAIGVSRTVIREALLRLRMMGLIESKKKKGAVITSPDIFGNLSKSMNPHLLDDRTLRDVFELRLVLEVGMADLLFHRIRREDIDALREIVREEPPDAEDRLFNVQHEIDFHGRLYEITGNETMRKFQKMLLPVFEYVHQSGLLKKPAASKKFISHKGLVDILENGTPEEFRNAMRNHLDNHYARLLD